MCIYGESNAHFVVLFLHVCDASLYIITIDMYCVFDRYSPRLQLEQIHGPPARACRMISFDYPETRCELRSADRIP